MNNTLCRLIIAAGLMAAAASCLASAPDTLVFSRKNIIYLLPAGSKTPIKITKGRSPSLSADQSKIAFTRRSMPDSEIYELVVWNLRTRRATVLTKRNLIYDVKWGPSSQTIAFTCFTGVGHLLCTIQADGKGFKRIGVSGKYGIDNFYSLRWAGDGRSLMFHDMNKVYRLDLCGTVVWKTSVKSLLGGSQISSTDSFAPCPNNPKLIAYTRFVKPTALFEKVVDEPNTALYVMDLVSKKHTRMTAENLFATSPIWSRDGQTLYFCGYQDIHAAEPYPFRIYSISRGDKALKVHSIGEEPSP